MDHLKPKFRTKWIYYCLFSLISFTSCTFYRKAPKHKPFITITKNPIEIKGGNFPRAEENALKQRLANQWDDSATVVSKSTLFFFTTIIKPPAFDTGYAGISARNMKAYMFHLGYYGAEVTYKADTTGNKVQVHYTVNAGKPTRIDTFNYRLKRQDLQNMAIRSQNESVIQKNNPITKAAVLGEISRLVDTFRNNGYYKFTAAELRMRGDTTIEALTTVTDDPFEQLRILAEAQQQKESPKIRLALVLNPPTDSSRLTKYYINKVFILPDFYPGDAWQDSNVTESNCQDFSIRYRECLFKSSFLGKSLTIKNGDLYRQKEFVNTVNNFSRAGVWKSVNARLWEVPGDTNKVNMVIELLPGRKFASEASVEASYSATSNTTNALGGNLFGLSLTLGLTNRNFNHEAIKWSNSVRGGIELNNNSRSEVSRLVNSQEIGYATSFVLPKLTWPFNTRLINLPPFWKKKPNVFRNGESFINLNLGYNNRLDLFNTQSVNLSYGANFESKKGYKWSIRLPNSDFSYLFNQTDSFRRILDSIPFLKYSYNTAFTLGWTAGFTKSHQFPKHLRSLSRLGVVRFNFEESAFTIAQLPILPQYKKRFVKADFEYKYNVNYYKTALALRGLVGIGIPARTDTTLPFFKQYFAGGSTSMRGWPIRGIGPGNQKQAPYGQNLFNNRTGDLQLELNAEYRYEIARIIPNTLTLRGALFVDIGNIWNMRNARADGLPDSSQFKIANFYRDLGVSAGTGFRIDLNYFIVRLDFGFRFKRPETSEINSGWKAPSVSFNDLIPKLFGRSDENRRWRYENFNFTVGISYPF